MNVAPDGIADEVNGYLELAREFEPQDARYLFNHRGHFVFVKPEERQFITAELIRRTTFTAPLQELTQRVEALRSAGWNADRDPHRPRPGKRAGGLGAGEGGVSIDVIARREAPRQSPAAGPRRKEIASLRSQ